MNLKSEQDKLKRAQQELGRLQEMNFDDPNLQLTLQGVTRSKAAEVGLRLKALGLPSMSPAPQQGDPPTSA